MKKLTYLLLALALILPAIAAEKKAKRTQTVAAYVQSGKKLKKPVKPHAATRALIDYAFRQKGKTNMTVALRVPSLAATANSVLTPVTEEVEIPNFPYPVVGDDGILIHYTNITVTALRWVTTQHGLRWDFMYRPTGTVVPLKPPIVAENAQQGQAAVVLPQGSYEWLPMFR